MARHQGFREAGVARRARRRAGWGAATLLIAVAGLSGCSKDEENGSPSTDSPAIEAAAALDSGEVMTDAVAASGIEEGLAASEELTIFVPTEDAVTAFTERTGADLTDTDFAAYYVKCHAVDAAVTRKDFENGERLRSLCGLQIQLGMSDSKLVVNESMVVGDLVDGVKAVQIDGVLVPDSGVTTGG